MFADHCAYKVVLDVNGYNDEFAYGVPEPFAAVFQPSNVYPVRENEFAVRFAAVADDCADIEPVPPFELKVTVNWLT